ncbi:MAG: NAD(P)/FAD-dependent oxidoreductase [Lachnospiraceae bacterium]|nr:NAD(P)/FAD-dependent oxidoreductase [Lachnospiraceae bacterium]
MAADIIVIGAGPAGMIAAIAAARAGAKVTLIEANEKAGKKLFITGKGRCNLTNACDTQEFFSHVLRNPKFLYSSIYNFDARAVMDMIEDAGCPVKTERGDRVFPVSDHSADVIAALDRLINKSDVEFIKNTKVSGLIRESYTSDDKKEKYNYIIKGVFLENKEKIEADAVIAATGGVSYPTTGSDGNFFRHLTSLGHTIVDLKPGLVPLVVKEDTCMRMMGLALKNVSVTLKHGKKLIGSGFGELLFTHFGVSGPLILAVSSDYSRQCGGVSDMLTPTGEIKKDKTAKLGKGNDFGHSSKSFIHGEEADLYIDLKPAVSEEELDERLIKEFSQGQNRYFKNVLAGLVPGQMKDVFPEICGIRADKPVNSITREERKEIVRCLKNMHFTIIGTRDFNEAIITVGGINVKEVNPSTMESKLVKGLFIAGEMLDTDSVTGGYNLQTAWSTGYLAGSSAAEGGL